MENKSVYLVSLLDKFSVKNNETYNPENKINKLATMRDRIEDIPYYLKQYPSFLIMNKLILVSKSVGKCGAQ